MSRQELRDELMTLLVAGHETTASPLAWAFERLAREPGVLRRLVAGARRGDDDAYLTATIQETLRRRPVLPNAAAAPGRPADRGRRRGDYQPGVVLVANAYLVHHDPAIYPEPYAFRPERFLDDPPGHLHVDPVRRRAPSLPRRELRAARDEDRARAVLSRLRGRATAQRRRGRAPAQHHDPPWPTALGSAPGVRERVAVPA